MNIQKSVSSLLVLLITACSAVTPTRALTPVTVQLKWTHTAQFGGFYAADQNGYYTEEGLDVTFIEGGPNIDSMSPVLDGTAQFGIAGPAQIMEARAEGKPVQALSVIFRRDPTVFFALASTGITRPEDFVGKQIRAVSDQPMVLHAMTSRLGISPKQYTEVNLPSDVALFASGEVPVWGAYITTLVVTVQRAGYAINIIYPDDYGVHNYGDTIFATDDFITSNPDLVLRFLRATLKGWTYAVEHPTDIGPMVIKYRPEADVELENAQMTASLPLVNTGEDHIGWMKPEVWAGMEKTLREQGVLTQPVDVTQVYTMQFLEEIYR